METQTIINNLAAKWCAKYPAQGARIMRGAMLALSGNVEVRGLSSWRVPGSEAGVSYLVTVTCGFPSCECKDATERGERCKRIWACALLTRLAAELVPSVKTRKALPRKKATTLEAVTAKHHAENHARLLSLPLAKVIPIR